MHFFLGDIWRMRDSLARVLPNWDEGIDGYGFVLGCRCFALEEAGQYEEAESIGRRAIDINENFIEKSFSSPLKEARKHFEKEYLITQIKKNHGNISKTADFIGMERSALHRKLKELGIKGIN